MFQINSNKSSVNAHLHFKHTTECRDFVTKMCRLNLDHPVEINFQVDKASRNLKISMPVDDDNRDNLDMMVAVLTQLKSEYQCN
jgi:hypothetical protein